MGAYKGVVDGLGCVVGLRFIVLDVVVVVVVVSEVRWIHTWTGGFFY